MSPSSPSSTTRSYGIPGSLFRLGRQPGHPRLRSRSGGRAAGRHRGRPVPRPGEPVLSAHALPRGTGRTRWGDPGRGDGRGGLGEDHWRLPGAGRGRAQQSAGFGLAGIGAGSIEHGRALGHSDLEALGVRGGAWTPALCAVLQEPDSPDPAVRIRIGELRERLRDCLPCAVAHGVRVWAGTDVVGTIADEIALLADHGLAARIVTHNDDPLEDPGVLARTVRDACRPAGAGCPARRSPSPSRCRACPHRTASWPRSGR